MSASVQTKGNSVSRVGLVMPLARQQGGAEALFVHLLEQDSEQLEYSVLFLQDGPLVETARSHGYDVTVLPTTHLSDPVNYLRTVAGVRRWANSKRLQAVFSWMLKAHFYVAPALALRKLPAGWFQHGIPIDGRIDRLATMLPARAVFCCSDHARAAQDSLPPRRRTFTCYPGVHLAKETVSQKTARTELSLPAEQQIVGMVARWERWKGCHVFIEAAKRLVEKDSKITCFLVGGEHPLDPEYAAEIRAQVSQSDMAGHFVLAGQRPAEEIPIWLASADVIVHPVTSPEPFGMAIVEAMGAAKVVLASALGGPEEIIEDGESGLLLPPGDVDAIVRRVTEVLLQPDRRRELAAAAAIRARKFSIEAFAERFESLVVEKLLAANVR